MAGLYSTETQRRTFALRTQAPEMWPRFLAGEIAIFDEEEVPLPGDDVLVKFSDGRCTVRRLAAIGESTVTLEIFSPKTSIVVNRSSISSLYVVVGRCCAGSWTWLTGQEQ